MSEGAVPPSGYITIIFTDIEDSARMTSALDHAYLNDLLPEHDRRTRSAVAANNGYVVKTIGDSFMLAFRQAPDAVACEVAIQEALAKPALAATDEAGKIWTIKVRIGVHTALEPLEPRPSRECPADYKSSDVDFAARVQSLGKGGQILVSDSTHEATKAGGRPWKDWPNRLIKSFDQPETIWELLWDGQSHGEPGSRFRPDKDSEL